MLVELFGWVFGATVSNCYNNGNVYSSDTLSEWNGRVGGIVGFSGSTQPSYIVCCYNSGNVEGASGAVGGITGSQYLSESYTKDSYIKNGITLTAKSGAVSYDIGKNNYAGYLVGVKKAGSVTCSDKNCSSSTKYGVLTEMPTVFSVVSGQEGSLNTETTSDVWKYDPTTTNMPELFCKK